MVAFSPQFEFHLAFKDVGHDLVNDCECTRIPVKPEALSRRTALSTEMRWQRSECHTVATDDVDSVVVRDTYVAKRKRALSAARREVYGGAQLQQLLGQGHSKERFNMAAQIGDRGLAANDRGSRLSRHHRNGHPNMCSHDYTLVAHR